MVGLFIDDKLLPHGSCYLWKSGLLWLHATSDILIALAYYSIPLALVYFVITRRDLAFRWMFLMFGVFILACGTTHLMNVWTIWNPDYLLDGIIKAFTALVSLVTAFMLWPLIPKALALPSPSELRQTNVLLEHEIIQHKQTDQALRTANDELERRVLERTKELEQVNEALRREIAERKNAEQKIQLLNIELERRVAERTAELQTANRELEAFSYSVSHDLRTPLRAIDGFSKALLKHYAEHFDEQAQDYLNRVRAASQRMGQLIDDLLKLSRVSRTEMQQSLVNMSDIAWRIFDDLKRLQPERQVQLNVAANLNVVGDTNLLHIVLENLLGNAWKFTKNREPVVIEFGVAELAGKKTYFVRDNGAGFDMTYMDKLFGAFQRLHTTADFEGTGIGLATVQRIIRRHGGEIWAEAAVDKGATFYFTLTDK